MTLANLSIHLTITYWVGVPIRESLMQPELATADSIRAALWEMCLKKPRLTSVMQRWTEMLIGICSSVNCMLFYRKTVGLQNIPQPACSALAIEAEPRRAAEESEQEGRREATRPSLLITFIPQTPWEDEKDQWCGAGTSWLLPQLTEAPSGSPGFQQKNNREAIHLSDGRVGKNRRLKCRRGLTGSCKVSWHRVRAGPDLQQWGVCLAL